MKRVKLIKFETPSFSGELCNPLSSIHQRRRRRLTSPSQAEARSSPLSFSFQLISKISDFDGAIELFTSI
ncbi:hypothetical protein AKJ16_DCAP12148 [Drosera capensis]